MNRSAFTNHELFAGWVERNRRGIERLRQQISEEKAQAQTGAHRQTGGTDMDTLTQAQTAWQADFTRLLDHALTSYHFAENAQDRRRTNTKAEEERELSHRATVKADAHTDAVRHLTEWVKARPYPATDQTAPTQAQAVAKEIDRLEDERGLPHEQWCKCEKCCNSTVTDSMREVNRLANLADDIQQYRNGWNGAMEAVEDVQSTSQDAQEWAKRVQYKTYKEFMRSNPTDEYMRGTSAALTHFLETGQTDRRAP